MPNRATPFRRMIARNLAMCGVWLGGIGLAVSVTGTTAGVYNVATPVEHQRRGYGRALTRAAVDEGMQRGCDHAILQSSPAGQPVYEAMGFTHLGYYVQLEGPPG